MHFDLDRVRANVAQAGTEDLLDRVTVYRAALEPAAVPVILEELRSRGLAADDILDHERARAAAVRDPAGVAVPCARCRKPAVTREWGWHRLFDRIPVFPWQFYLCADHRAPGL
jgi:hypothetical protein